LHASVLINFFLLLAAQQAGAADFLRPSACVYNAEQINPN
jgi:hypothetical protein